MNIVKASEHLRKRNPIELTNVERRGVDKILYDKTMRGNSGDILKAMMAHSELKVLGSQGAPLVNLSKLPAICYTSPVSEAKDKIFINLRIPEELRKPIEEHEGVELYFRRHEARATEIVKALGIEYLQFHDPFNVNKEAHFVALYFQYKLAQEMGIIDEVRKYMTSVVISNINSTEMQTIRMMMPSLYPDIVSNQPMQLVGHDMVIGILEKNSRAKRKK